MKKATIRYLGMGHTQKMDTLAEMERMRTRLALLEEKARDMIRSFHAFMSLDREQGGCQCDRLNIACRACNEWCYFLVALSQCEEIFEGHTTMTIEEKKSILAKLRAGVCPICAGKVVLQSRNNGVWHYCPTCRDKHFREADYETAEQETQHEPSRP